MRLIADRFIVSRPAAASPDVDRPSSSPLVERGCDLATGADVTIFVSMAGGPAESLQWSLRCGRFAHLHHGTIARLLDYGPLGESHRFEAWRAAGEWRASGDAARHAREDCDAYLSASDLTRTQNPRMAGFNGLPVVIPDPGAGLERDSHENETPVVGGRGSYGLETITRAAVAALGEVVADAEAVEPRAIALHGEHGSGLSVATREVARLARLHGMVPISAGIDDPAIWSLIGDRTALVIAQKDQHDDVGGLQPFVRAAHQCGQSSGWRRWLCAAARRGRPHVLVITSRYEIPRIPNVRLETISEEALIRAVRPHALAVRHSRGIARAARQAAGRPAKFAAALRVVPQRGVVSEIRGFSRAAETPPSYSVPSRVVAVRRWPAGSDLVVLRNRVADAGAQLENGRHTSAARVILGSVGALRRRGDLAGAARGLLTLARARARRGLVAESRHALDEARACAHQAAEDDVLLEVVIASAHASIDAGMLIDAEAMARGALAAARAQNRPALGVDAVVGLARSLFWQGRFEESRAIVSGVDRKALSDEQVVAVAGAAARAAIGCGAAGGGLSDAARALVAAERSQDVALNARALLTAAFAHLSAGDHAAVARDVESSISRARAARRPLLALRARLVGSEALRRAGQAARAAKLVCRLGRLPPARMPATVRAQAQLLQQLLAGADAGAVIERLSATTGLRGLALFVPPAAGQRSLTSIGWADWLELLTSVQTAQDDCAALKSVCGHIRRELRAATVGFLLPRGRSHETVATEGVRLNPEFADRVLAAGQLVHWQPPDSGAEAGVPVRYAGRSTGALIVRWTVGAPSDPARVEAVLTIAAAVAAPTLALLASQRTAAVICPDGLIGESGAIAEVRRLVDRAAAVPFPVLVEGESGSGKELVARALHRRSPRRERAFSAVNCAALPDELLEAELFGHARGAFTGAVAERTGVIEEAHGGTLFLDEVGELSLRAQAKLLRTLQEGEVRRVGENVPRRVDVRVVAATNRNLRQESAENRFRLDLLYRLDVIRISLPPLRERLEDLPLLIDRFWSEAAERAHSRALLGAPVVAALTQYPWPGNVRELQNVMASLAVRAPRRGLVPASALPSHITADRPASVQRLDHARRVFEAQFVRAALARAGGRRGQTADELGLSRQGLAKLLARLGMAE